MEIFLIRHAEAVDAAATDAARELTAEGVERFRRIATALGRLGFRFDRIYHSPYARAEQTAKLLHEVTAGELIVEPGLTDEPDSVLLRKLTGSRVALVGHEPFMSELLALLLVGERTRARAFPFKKGGVAWVSGVPSPSGCTIRALWPPSALAHD